MKGSVASDERWWALELAAGWTIVPSHEAPERAPLQEDDCVAVVPPTGDAALRIFAGDYSLRGTPPQRWIEFSALLATRRGWVPEPWASGGFTGIHARQPTDGVWWRVWYLGSGNIGLNALYRCAPELAGRDDAEVDQMLRTLQFIAPAG